MIMQIEQMELDENGIKFCLIIFIPFFLFYMETA